jgi:hypothetical protein
MAKHRGGGYSHRGMSPPLAKREVMGKAAFRARWASGAFKDRQLQRALDYLRKVR